MRFSHVPRIALRWGVAGLVAVLATSSLFAAAPAPPAPAAAPAAPAAPKPAAPAPAKPAASAPAKPAEPIVRIYMPDAQLTSHSVRVYVTRDLALEQNPRLQLL